MRERKYPPRSDLSPSKLSAWSECPERFRRQAKEGKPADERPFSQAGTAAHGALEVLAERVIEERSRGNAAWSPTWEDVESALAECAPSDPDAYAKAREALETSWASVDLSHVAFAEYPFQWSPAASGPTVGGIMDRVDIHPVFRGRGSVEITDYKFGRPRSLAELKRAPQTLVYLATARQLWSDTSKIAGWSMTYHYLASNVKVTVDWTESLDALARQWVPAVWSQIKAEAGEARVGRHCEWCPWQSKCSKWTKYLGRLERGEIEVGEVEAEWTDRAWILERYYALGEVERTAKAGRETLKKFVHAHLEREGSNEIHAGGFKAKRSAKRLTVTRSEVGQ